MMTKTTKTVKASVAKATVTDRRCAVKVTYPSGRVLTYSCTYNGHNLSIKSPTDLPDVSQTLLRQIFAYMKTFVGDENNGQRVQRLAAEFTGLKSISDLPAGAK